MTTFPALLAGPILRRATTSEVVVWAATSVEPGPGSKLELFDADSGSPIASVSTPPAKVKLGANLWVLLLRVAPARTGDHFPAGTLIAYDFVLDSGGALRLDKLVKHWERGALSSGGSQPFRPTFLLQRQGDPLTVLYGSCRKPHADGDDESARWSAVLKHGPRPTALLLIGDQIYADDVAAPLLTNLTKFAADLLGWEERVPVNGKWLHELPAGQRTKTIQAAKLSTEDTANHLIGFGEYVAMYLAMWNPDFDLLPDQKQLGQWAGTDKALQTTAQHLLQSRAKLGEMRRVLANVPTYMILDDHDVSDDWNLDQAWFDGVGRPGSIGRRIVANATAAYWALQGWGNDPEQFQRPWIDVIEKYLALQLAKEGNAPASEVRKFEDHLWNTQGQNARGKAPKGTPLWSYFVPSRPPIFVLDTRTRRELGRGTATSGLVNQRGRDELRAQVAAHWNGSEPLLLVLGDALRRLSGGRAAAREPAPRPNGDQGRARSGELAEQPAGLARVPRPPPVARPEAGRDLLGRRPLRLRCHLDDHTARFGSAKGGTLTIHQMTSSALQNGSPKTRSLGNKYVLGFLDATSGSNPVEAGMSSATIQGYRRRVSSPWQHGVPKATPSGDLKADAAAVTRAFGNRLLDYLRKPPIMLSPGMARAAPGGGVARLDRERRLSGQPTLVVGVNNGGMDHGRRANRPPPAGQPAVDRHPSRSDLAPEATRNMPSRGFRMRPA